MKKKGFIVTLACLFSATLVISAQDTKLETQKEKISYVIGWDIGSNLKSQSININVDLLILGLKDALAGKKQLLSEAEMQEVSRIFQQEHQAKQAEVRNKSADKNKKAGEEFLAQNKTKKDVKVLPSGLQYKVISEGAGEIPKLTDTVSVHYKGTLIDGTEFDSSYSRNQPATFPVSGVIKGWVEALQLMKVGSKWELYIPSSLAYGDRGASDKIGPNATLIFSIELLSIQKK